MWLLSLSIFIMSLNKSDSLVLEKFSAPESNEVASIKFAQSLKILIEAKKNIISTEVGIVNMLHKSNEHRMERIIEKLFTSKLHPIPWTIIQDSDYIQKEILELLKYKTLLIFFVEQNDSFEFETLNAFQYNITTYWATIVIIPLGNNRSDTETRGWSWINQTMGKIHSYNYASAVLFSFQNGQEIMQMWTYDFYPEYKLKLTSDVDEIIRDKSKDLMGYKIRLLGSDNFPNGYFKDGKYLGPSAQLYQSICEHFNASKQLNILKYNDSVFDVYKNLLPLGESELFVGSVLHLLPYNGSITAINAKVSPGLSLIIPRREASITSFFNSGVKLILLFIFLASLIWFLIPWCIKWILRVDTFENKDVSKNRSIFTIFLFCYASILNVGINIAHQSTSDRLFLAGYLCFCFFVVSSFQTDMITAISTKPKFEQDILSLDAFKKSGLHVLIQSRFYDILKKKGNNWENTFHITDNLPWDYLRREDLFREIEALNHPAFVVTNYKARILLHSSVNVVNSEKYFYELNGIFGETLESNLITPSLPYRRNLEIYLLRVKDNGLNKYWDENVRTHFSEYLGVKEKFGVTQQDDDVLRFNNMKIILLIPVFGSASGFAILILEKLLVTLMMTRKKESRILFNV